MPSQLNGYATDEIYFTYRDLAEGQTKGSEICPSCEGGSSEERSLTVTRRGDLLLFNCHRASCPFHGAINLAGRARGKLAQEQDSERKTPKPIIKTYPINEATLGFLATKYYISRETLKAAGLSWSGDGDGPYARRVCFPIYDPNFKERGQVFRSYAEGVVPKTLNRMHNEDSVASSWYKFIRKSSTLVLVEDQMSAIKLAPHTHSLALLGTHLSEAKAKEIIEASYDRVIISLDNDATYESIKTQLAFRNRIKNFYVVGLGKDIKDMTQKELNLYVSNNLQ